MNTYVTHPWTLEGGSCTFVDGDVYYPSANDDDIHIIDSDYVPVNWLTALDGNWLVIYPDGWPDINI